MENIGSILGWTASIVGGFIILLILLSMVKIVRPMDRGLVEKFGKYKSFAEPGLHLIVPFVEKLYLVNITEQMVDAEPQEIITDDNLNASVDAQVYFRVGSDEDSVKKSQYSVFDYRQQIVQLARTTLRNIIGTMTLKKANSERGTINSKLFETLDIETKGWGIQVVRTELKEINPPADVQETMNKVVKANNEKIAAIDFATATETQADGERRAAIKRAEGNKKAAILVAEGEAAAIRLVNESAEKYFKGNAVLLKQLQTVSVSLQNNSKVIIPAGSSLVNLVGNLTGTDTPPSSIPDIGPVQSIISGKARNRG